MNYQKCVINASISWNVPNFPNTTFPSTVGLNYLSIRLLLSPYPFNQIHVLLMWFPQCIFRGGTMSPTTVSVCFACGWSLLFVCTYLYGHICVVQIVAWLGRAKCILGKSYCCWLEAAAAATTMGQVKSALQTDRMLNHWQLTGSLLCAKTSLRCYILSRES